jgi:DNA-binding transcriptional LysR family regulator
LLVRALVEFAQAGSIAGAAGRLFRTPSAITRQVQRLEAQLGAELLDRSVKPPRLNSLGSRVLERARDLLQRTEMIGEVWAEHPGCSIRQGAFFGRPSSIGWSVPASLP